MAYTDDITGLCPVYFLLIFSVKFLLNSVLQIKFLKQFFCKNFRLKLNPIARRSRNSLRFIRNMLIIKVYSTYHQNLLSFIIPPVLIYWLIINHNYNCLKVSVNVFIIEIRNAFLHFLFLKKCICVSIQKVKRESIVQHILFRLLFQCLIA